MNRTTASDFSETSAGETFRELYGRVLSRWPVKVEKVDVRSPHGITRVNICGPVDGAPVILLSGGGATSAVWFGLAASLTERHRVHAVDLLGDVGCSTGTAGIRDVDDLMEWLGIVAAELGLDAPAIVGHSYGAMVALAYAVRRPGQVQRLVLLDPNACFAGMSSRYLARAVPLLVRPTGARLRALVEWESAGLQVDPDWLALAAYGAEHFPASKTVVPRRPRRPELLDVRTDTTVVLAGRSRVHDVERVGRKIDAFMPRARTVVLPGESHYTLPMASPAGLGRIVLDALG
ncbi:alpha/beta fold hydrolase [Rhodococcus sp. ABRD24]|uniref:alpha/beta fold hydrolase n=1 Tax=Rhodococcus sp. ABRD24 TaxID=2507582 RepID=UPI00103AE874|nr:alpha/beta fold hydrolase [Rhodococcus sp. ABRD24]QBJ98383.1 alpha/beta fold hydrolase [Rhodococcus sp. ABRD24]